MQGKRRIRQRLQQPILEHVTRDGSPRLVTACDLPVTARGVVTLVATNWGLFAPTGTGFRLLEIAPGMRLLDVGCGSGLFAAMETL